MAFVTALDLPAAPGVAPLRIGPFPVDPPVVLAPMAGITNVAFRRLCREYGAGLYVCEMITSRALVERHPKTLEMITFDPDEHPRSMQLYGVDPETMAAAVRMIADEDLADHVDMNFGCPVPKVTRKGGGSALPYKRRLFEDIVTAAVRAGVGSVVLDSFHEIARLSQIAHDHGVVQPVMVRVTVGVEAHTHEFIATAHEDQKFGFSLANGGALEAARRVIKSDSLELVGLHSHIGSQIFDDDGFGLSAHRVVAMLSDLRAEHGPEVMDKVTTVDLGGGLGIAYTPEDDPLPVRELATRLHDIVRKECDAAGFEPPRVAVEPGRAIAGPGTVTVYEVGTVKDVELDGGVSRRYVSVDGGMSDNIRTSLYDAVYDCRLVSRSAEAPPVLSRIVGKHCESGDVVVRDCWLPEDIAPGDLLAVAATGAYCYVMASNYNRLPKPPVVAVKDGQARLLLRGETEEDLLRLEV